MQTPYMKMFSIRRRTKMSKAISRRNFLMATGAVGAAGLLAACGGSMNVFLQLLKEEENNEA